MNLYEQSSHIPSQQREGEQGYEQAVKLLQAIRQEIISVQNLIKLFSRVQAEDRERFSRRGQPGVFSENGYRALVRGAEEQIQLLQEMTEQVQMELKNGDTRPN